MKSALAIGIVAVLLLSLYSCNNKKNVLGYVDPFIGTDAHGHTFPGATTPNGMIQLSPSNDFKNWDWCSGYHYSDSIIKGFAHTHVSGTGLAGLGDILVTGTTGEPKLKPGTESDPDEGYRSRFNHDNESASPGYYQVYLMDYDVNVELSASPRVGFHRYTFPAGNSNIIIDPQHAIRESVVGTRLAIVGSNRIEGIKHSIGESGDRNTYFVAEFSRPFDKAGVGLGGIIEEDKREIEGRDARAFASFETEANERIEVKVALSFVNLEGARKNFEAEASNKNFDQALADAQKMWLEKINKIEVSGPEEIRRIFYTGTYHSFIAPNLISDVDGKYFLNGEVYQTDYPQYSTYSTWDTFRALHPLLNIIDQETNAMFVNSLVSRKTVSDIQQPLWELAGFDNMCMPGYSTTPVIADAIIKDVEGIIDAEGALQAMIEASVNQEKSSPNYGGNGLEYYTSIGYVPAEIATSVSSTLEDAYYDWCIAMAAKKLGEMEVYEEYMQRAKTFVNVFNKEEKYFWPKKINGEWLEIDWNSWEGLIRNYISGNVWGYSTFVPHGVHSLIELQGGPEKFTEWLDKIVNDTSQIEGAMHVDISGFIGKYGHGDEPSQQFPYLYVYAGKPWRTQEIVRKVMLDFYNDTPSGMINNEDCGQMSAWYMFSAMGFYPACPGDGQYIIGSPYVENATINLESGKRFGISVKNLSKTNKYIKSVSLNGQSLDRAYILHEEIMNGGRLDFVMDDQPNKKWASQQSNLPDINNDDKVKDVSPFSFGTQPPFETDDLSGIFYGSVDVSLKSNTMGARIYYTLDDSEPNENSRLHTEPVSINRTSTLQARAFSELPESVIFSKKYYKTYTAGSPDTRVKIASVISPDERYGAADGTGLIDGKFGTYTFSDGWSGWNGNDMEVVIDLGKSRNVSSVSIGYMISDQGWIFPPKQVIAEGSKTNSEFRALGQMELPAMDGPTSNTILRPILNVSPKQVRYIKIKLINTGILPEWHGAAGQKSWMFIDEILIN